MSKTVFILGAGASIPYGYPSGPKLVSLILDSLDPNYLFKFSYKNKFPGSGNIMESEITQTFSDHGLYVKHGFSTNLIAEFSEALKNSNKDSIDSFLLERKSYYEIGKFAIANCILKCENPTEFQATNQNWLKYLWNKINQSRNDFISRDISFITFNYDRLLEYYFYTSLKYSFDMSDKEIMDALNSKQIIHLHGVVGLLPWQDQENGFDYNYTGSDINSVYNRVSKASKNIKIVYDRVEEADQNFDRTYDLLKDANRIYILGLGFHNLNLSRLKIQNLDKRIICSAFGLTKHECDLIESQYPMQLQLDKIGYDSLEFLRNYLTLK
ncbi:MAG: hypothetical protein EPN88_06400 [Bacteroidetes bacterium]|nr:MAG: hypothetical protein EPN88_06400 [Bacteroidota bacterium]